MNDECIEWDGHCTPTGYGRLWFKGKTWSAHRLAWTQVHGPIPDGLHVLHHCDNPPCYNVAHLFLGTHQDNMADRDAKGRCGAGSVNAAKTHCPSGHPYAGENLFFNNRGDRCCRICVRVRNAASRRRTRARRAA